MTLNHRTEEAVETIARADAEVEEAFVDHRDEQPIKALGLIGEIGDQPQLRLISGGCIAAGLLASNSRLLRAGFRMLLAHEVATLAKNFIKDRVDRTRPRTAGSLEDRKPRPGRNPAKEESSFPSGHTAGAVSVARAFSREFPEYRQPALILAGLVATAQIPRCAHYVTDVGAGAAVGLSSEAATSLIWKSRRR